MRDAYRNTPVYDDFFLLEEQGKKAAEGDTRIMNLTNDFMTIIGKSRGESEKEIEANNRRATGSVKTNREYGGSTVRLAKSEIKRNPSIYDNYGKLEEPRKRVRQVAKQTSINLKKLTLAASLTLALAGGGAYVAAVTKAQQESFERATEIVNVVDAGDYHPQLGGYDLVIQANGDCYFRDADGKTFSRYGEGENTISANDVGELVEMANQSHQR